MSKDVKSIPGRFYAVTMKTAGTVHAKFAGGSLLLLASAASGGQVFVQAYSDLLEVSDNSAEVRSVKAPVTVGGTGVTAEAFAQHEKQEASMDALGHVKTGSVGVTLENGKLRIKFRTSHSGFEADSNNAVYVNTGTDAHPTHGTIAPVGTDSAGKLCVPALTSELIALLEVLLANKDVLLSQIGASEADAAAISEAAEAMAIAEAEEAAAAEEAAEVDTTANMAR